MRGKKEEEEEESGLEEGQVGSTRL